MVVASLLSAWVLARAMAKVMGMAGRLWGGFRFRSFDSRAGP